MTLKGIYIDDVSPEVNAKLLSSDEITYSPITKILNVSDMTDQILHLKPDALILDYRLDLNKTDHDKNNNYRAGLLAQSIREKAQDNPKIDFPIILVSSEDNIRKYFNPDKTSHDLFDEWYRKESLSKDERVKDINKQIVSLANGYKLIIDNLEAQNLAYVILGLSQDEAYVLESSDITYDVNKGTSPHIVARVVLNKFIKVTGLLLRPSDVAARLAIDLPKDKSENEWLFSYFSKEACDYRGIFSDGWRRIWKHRFDAWAENLFGKLITSIPGDERVHILNERLGWDCKPSVSAWSKSSKELFSFACASCRRPTEIKHSVSLHDELSLKYVEKARICYDCVQNGTYEEFPVPLRIAQQDLQIAEEVKSKKRPQ